MVNMDRARSPETRTWTLKFVRVLIRTTLSGNARTVWGIHMDSQTVVTFLNGSVR